MIFRKQFQARSKPPLQIRDLPTPGSDVATSARGTNNSRINQQILQLSLITIFTLIRDFYIIFWFNFHCVNFSFGILTLDFFANVQFLHGWKFCSLKTEMLKFLRCHTYKKK